jgi:hypothetical protein
MAGLDPAIPATAVSAVSCAIVMAGAADGRVKMPGHDVERERYAEPELSPLTTLS